LADRKYLIINWIFDLPVKTKCKIELLPAGNLQAKALFILA